MLSRDERRQFEEITARLRADDPAFSATSKRARARPSAEAIVMCCVLMSALPVLTAIAGLAIAAFLTTLLGVLLAARHLRRRRSSDLGDP